VDDIQVESLELIRQNTFNDSETRAFNIFQVSSTSLFTGANLY
jgi:hypothetical protein